jgi:peptidoglycan/LPS O-acetylase OafA/YrhL
MATDKQRQYALSGAALFLPIATMFWLDYWHGNREALYSPGFVLTSLASGGCAALASADRRAAVLSVPLSALAGLAVERFVSACEALEDGP